MLRLLKGSGTFLRYMKGEAKSMRIRRSVTVRVQLLQPLVNARECRICRKLARTLLPTTKNPARDRWDSTTVSILNAIYVRVTSPNTKAKRHHQPPETNQQSRIWRELGCINTMHK